MPVAAPCFIWGIRCRCRPKAAFAAPHRRNRVRCGARGAARRPVERTLRAADGRGLVNTSFDVDYFDGPGFAAWLIGGESRDPDAVCEAFRAQVRRMADGGVAEKDFLAARSALYGSLVARLDSVENCGEMLASGHFYGRNPFDLLDAAAHLDIQSIYRRLREDFDDEASTLSVIRPMDG